jgi:hypothetical protein
MRYHFIMGCFGWLFSLPWCLVEESPSVVVVRSLLRCSLVKLSPIFRSILLVFILESSSFSFMNAIFESEGWVSSCLERKLDFCEANKLLGKKPPFEYECVRDLGRTTLCGVNDLICSVGLMMSCGLSPRIFTTLLIGCWWGWISLGLYDLFGTINLTTSTCPIMLFKSWKIFSLRRISFLWV